MRYKIFSQLAQEECNQKLLGLGGRLSNTSTASLQRGKNPNEYPVYDTKQSDF